MLVFFLIFFFTGISKEPELFYPIDGFLNQFMQNGGTEVVLFVFVVLESLYFGWLVQKYQLLYKTTWLPSLFFGIFSLLFPVNMNMLPAHLSGMFLLFSVNSLFKAQGKERTLPEVFSSGFFLGMAILAEPQALVFLFTLMFGMFIFKPSRILDYLQLLAGIAMPLYFYGIVAFLLPEVPALQSYLSLPLLVMEWRPLGTDWNSLITAAFGLLILFFVFIRLQQNFFKNTVKVRKYQQFMLVYFLSSVFVVTFSPQPVFQNIIYLAGPISIYLAYYFLSDKRKVLREVVFIAMLFLWLNAHLGFY